MGRNVHPLGLTKKQCKLLMLMGAPVILSGTRVRFAYQLYVQKNVCQGPFDRLRVPSGGANFCVSEQGFVLSHSCLISNQKLCCLRTWKSLSSFLANHGFMVKHVRCSSYSLSAKPTNFDVCSGQNHMASSWPWTVLHNAGCLIRCGFTGTTSIGCIVRKSTTLRHRLKLSVLFLHLSTLQFSLRLGFLYALRQCLRLKELALFWMGIPCSLLIFMSVGTHRRDLEGYDIFGDTTLESVVKSNLALTRAALLALVVTVRNAFWVAEQPGSSKLPEVPYYSALLEDPKIPTYFTRLSATWKTQTH